MSTNGVCYWLWPLMTGLKCDHVEGTAEDEEGAYVAISWACIELSKFESMPMEESVKAAPADTAVGLIREIADAKKD